LVAGQYMDVADAALAGADGPRRLHELKTVRLIAAIVQCVLLLARLGDPENSQLRRFAESSAYFSKSWTTSWT